MNFSFDFQESAIDDRDLFDDFSYEPNESPSQANKRRAVTRPSSTLICSPSPSPSVSSKTSESTTLKEMAVDALRSMGQTQPKDKFGALGDYIAAELRSLTQQQAEYAKSKLSRAFNDIVDEAIQKVRTVFLNILMSIEELKVKSLNRSFSLSFFQ